MHFTAHYKSFYRWPVIMLAIILALSSISLTYPPPLTQHTFSGTITDLLGNPLEGIEVKFLSSSGDSCSAMTDSDGHYETGINTAVLVDERDAATSQLGISAPWPNPSSGHLAVLINVPRQSTVSVHVYTIQGVDVSDRVLVDRLSGPTPTGQYLQQINLSSQNSDLASGTYVIRVSDGKSVAAAKMTFLKGTLAGTAPSQALHQESIDWSQAGHKAAKSASTTFTMITADPDSNFVTHTKLVTADEGMNDLGIETMLDNDPDVIKFVNETVRKRGYTVRWVEKPEVYINMDNVIEITKKNIFDYLTIDSGGEHNGIIADLTNGLLTYTVSEMNLVTTADMPVLGDEQTMLFDSIQGKNGYSLRGRTDGSIKSSYVTLANSTTATAMLHETASCLAHVDDYNGFTSMHNDPISVFIPTALDIKAYKYAYSRPPRTVAPDNEPGTY